MGRTEFDALAAMDERFHGHAARVGLLYCQAGGAFTARTRRISDVEFLRLVSHAPISVRVVVPNDHVGRATTGRP
jgi:hypothetical protein